jgi:hypothetical protein
VPLVLLVVQILTQICESSTTRSSESAQPSTGTGGLTGFSAAAVEIGAGATKSAASVRGRCCTQIYLRVGLRCASLSDNLQRGQR